MSVRVSVVIPTYKSAAWIEETLDSVRQQTFGHDELEVIVIDDVSPDDSVAVARRFLERNPMPNARVVVREKNAGVAANRNAGWNLASGEWIQFLDADDLLAPHKIELLMRAVGDAPDDLAVVYSNWQYYTLEQGTWQPTGPLKEPFVDDDPVLRMVEQPAFGYVGPTLIRRSFLVKTGGFDEIPNISEDADLMLRIAMAGGRFRQARSQTAAFLYRQSPNSLWRAYSKNKQAMRNMLFTFRRAEEFLRTRRPDGGLPENARLAVAQRYSNFAYFYLEYDPESFRMLMGWLRALGFSRPLETPKLSAVSALIGFENAVRLRTAYWTLRNRLRRR